MKWKLAPNGIRMMKKSFMKNILNMGIDRLQPSETAADAPSFLDGSLRANATLPPPSENKVSFSLPSNLDSDGEDEKSSLKNRGEKKEGDDLAREPKDAKMVSPKKVEPEIIRGVEKQIKDAIHTAKERSAHQRPLSNKKLENPKSQASKPPSWAKTHHPIDPKMVLFLMPDSIEAECFKLFRSLMFSSSSDRVRRSILMASVGSEETLMIECDLGHPELRDLMGIGRVMGLDDYFSQNVLCREKLHHIDNGQMFLVSAAGMHKPPKGGARPAEMAGLIDELVSSYDRRTVILDSAPSVYGAGRMHPTENIGGALMVIDYGMIPQENINGMIELIGKDKILGSLKKNGVYKMTSSDRSLITQS